MNFTQEQINDLYDAEVVTQDDDNLGGVGEVYLDDNSGQPSWVSVKTGWFGTNHSLVPLEGAQLSGGRLRVPHSKDTIKNAPNVDADQHLSEQEQDELFRYYGGVGMDTSRYGSTGSDLGTTGSDLGTTGNTTGEPVVAGNFSAGGANSDLDRDRDRGMDLGADGGADRGVGTGVGTGTHHDHDREGSMTLHEERVDVGTERRETGRVRLRKHVVTDQETVTVPVEREEYEIVREPVTGDTAGTGRLGEDEASITLHEERPVIEKDVVATEQVGLDKRTVTDEQTVVTDVSHEEVDVDRDVTDRDGLGTDRDGLGTDGGTHRR